jgi:hypothetical protein
MHLSLQGGKYKQTYMGGKILYALDLYLRQYPGVAHTSRRRLQEDLSFLKKGLAFAIKRISDRSFK